MSSGGAAAMPWVFPLVCLSEIRLRIRCGGELELLSLSLCVCICHVLPHDYQNRLR